MGSPGLDFQAGASQAAVDQVGSVLDLLQPALDDSDQASVTHSEWQTSRGVPGFASSQIGEGDGSDRDAGREGDSVALYGDGLHGVQGGLYRDRGTSGGAPDPHRGVGAA
jgi:hypothetical protein